MTDTSVPELKGGLDAPVPGEPRQAAFLIVGWLQPADARDVTAVRARIDSRMFPGTFGIARPDVQAYLGGGAESDRCGYEIPAVAAGALTCTVEVQQQSSAWRIIETFDVGSPVSPVTGGADMPVDRQPWQAAFVLSGWCVHVDGAPIVAVRASVGGRSFHGRHGLSRPDVAAVWGNAVDARSCGYEVRMAAPAAGLCTVEAQLADGTWHALSPASVSAPDTPFFGNVEAPIPAEPRPSHFVVSGWCLHAGGDAIRAIRARIGRRELNGTYGLRRPDVVALWGETFSSEQCGYQISAVVHEASDCVIEAQTADGHWRLVQKIAIAASTDTRPASRIRWARFWANAWLGRPHKWEDLSAVERDFTVAVARNRGWFNLDAEPQYAPRPMRPERFPRARTSDADLPRVAIVTPSYQQGPFLEETIRSVLGQRGARIGYVVQDGGSTDGSVDIIRRHETELAAWESGPDGGQAAAIVRGFSKIPGGPDDLMMYLNSDDVLMDGAARFVAEHFARNPDIDVVYGHRVLIDEQGQEVGRWITPRRECDDLRVMDRVPQETLFWRRRIWDRVGGIDPDFQFALDWDLLLRFQAAGARMVRLPWFLAAFRLHPLQKTNARLHEDGIPEMERLWMRTLGRIPVHDELHLAACRAQVDSALLSVLLRWGWRI